MTLDATEARRKAVHVGMASFALLLRWLDWKGAALCALAAFAFNLLVLPRLGGRGLFRDDDRARSESARAALEAAKAQLAAGAAAISAAASTGCDAVDSSAPLRARTA